MSKESTLHLLNKILIKTKKPETEAPFSSSLRTKNAQFA